MLVKDSIGFSAPARPAGRHPSAHITGFEQARDIDKVQTACKNELYFFLLFIILEYYYS